MQPSLQARIIDQSKISYGYDLASVCEAKRVQLIVYEVWFDNKMLIVGILLSLYVVGLHPIF